MPKGYVLDKYYDALRVVCRKMYSQQIKLLGGSIKNLGFYNYDTYGLIIGKLNDGIYDNLGELFKKSVYGGRSNFVGTNKSSLGQDFMSPLELRLNAIAVKRAREEIEYMSGRGCTLNNVMDACYSTGRSVASEIAYLKGGEEEFDFQVQSPVLSTKPIIKKYDHNLVLGTLPQGSTFEGKSPEEKQAKAKLVYANIDMFGKIKKKLIELGMASASDRAMAFGKLNSNYYETDAGNTHTLELCKILITDKKDYYVSMPELQMNYDKLSIAYNNIKDITYPLTSTEIYSKMLKVGQKARSYVITKYSALPELYSGFYHTYIDSDKRIAIKKARETAVQNSDGKN